MIINDLDIYEGVSDQSKKFLGFWKYGLSYRIIIEGRTVYYPIPFHFIANWWRRLKDRIQYSNPSKWDRALSRARNNGIVEGDKRARKHLFTRADLHEARKDGYDQAFRNMDKAFEEEYGHPPRR